MEIKNLSQLKKAINNGSCFRIVKHYIKPAYEGQIRKANKIQTNGFYSIVPNPQNETDMQVVNANRGLGSWLEYGKASDWTFENGVCKQNFRGNDIWEIEFVEVN